MSFIIIFTSKFHFLLLPVLPMLFVVHVVLAGDLNAYRLFSLRFALGVYRYLKFYVHVLFVVVLDWLQSSVTKYFFL